MKHLSAAVLSSLLALSAQAQNGFYLAPSIGASISNSDRSAYNIGIEGYTTASTKSPIVSKNLQLGIGYQYKHWRFQSGIQYFSSGYKVDKLMRDPGFNPNVPPDAMNLGAYRISLNQVSIPLQVGYVIPIGQKLSLVPYLGVNAGYTFSGTASLDNGITKERWSMPGAALNDYGRFTMWLTAGVQAEYKLTDKISVTGGPSVQYMMTGTGNNYEKNFYNVNFNLGLKVGLQGKPKHKPAGPPPDKQ